MADRSTLPIDAGMRLATHVEGSIEAKRALLDKITDVTAGDADDVRRHLAGEVLREHPGRQRLHVASPGSDDLTVPVVTLTGLGLDGLVAFEYVHHAHQLASSRIESARSSSAMSTMSCELACDSLSQNEFM
jgi:hypothetical protein